MILKSVLVHLYCGRLELANWLMQNQYIKAVITPNLSLGPGEARGFRLRDTALYAQFVADLHHLSYHIL
jgi:hypothetical protein